MAASCYVLGRSGRIRSSSKMAALPGSADRAITTFSVGIAQVVSLFRSQKARLGLETSRAEPGSARLGAARHMSEPSQARLGLRTSWPMRLGSARMRLASCRTWTATQRSSHIYIICIIQDQYIYIMQLKNDKFTHDMMHISCVLETMTPCRLEEVRNKVGFAFWAGLSHVGPSSRAGSRA